MRLLRLAWLAALLAVPSRAGAGEPFVPQTGLYAMSFAAGSLDPGRSTASKVLTVDGARSATIIIATTEAVDFQIRLPDRSRLTSKSRSDDRRRWVRVDSQGQPPGPLLPGFGSGSNLMITIAQPPPGSYQVAISRSGRSRGAVPYVITLLLDSDLRMGLWFQSRQVFLNEPFMLSVVLLNGEKPGIGAQVTASLFQDPADGVSKASRLGEIHLHDDGKDGDAVAGDGLYTSQIVPKTPGLVRVAVRGTGASSGTAFERHLGAVVEVAERTVEIRTGAPPHLPDDDRPDNVFDVPLELMGPTGRYEVVVVLHTASGASAGENVIVDLKDPTRLAIAFAPERLKLLGDRQKIVAEVIEVYELTMTGKILRGRVVSKP